MKALGVVVGVLAIQVLLVFCYVAAAGIPAYRIALLVAALSAVIWFGFVWGLGRLLITSLACIVLAYGGIVVLALVDLPTALVCERGRTNVEATPHIMGGRFEERRVGPCVFYNPESRPASLGVGD